MKLKYLLTAALVFNINSSFAMLSPQFIASSSVYACGIPTTTSAEENWCGCFYNYLVAGCHAMGGSEETCTDAAMRQNISEYGGPSVICQYYHGQDMDEKTCMSTLNHYLTQCPLVP